MSEDISRIAREITSDPKGDESARHNVNVAAQLEAQPTAAEARKERFGIGIGMCIIGVITLIIGFSKSPKKTVAPESKGSKIAVEVAWGGIGGLAILGGLYLVFAARRGGA